jgi:hypothetical protein
MDYSIEFEMANDGKIFEDHLTVYSAPLTVSGKFDIR